MRRRRGLLLLLLACAAVLILIALRDRRDEGGAPSGCDSSEEVGEPLLAGLKTTEKSDPASTSGAASEAPPLGRRPRPKSATLHGTVRSGLRPVTAEVTIRRLYDLAGPGTQTQLCESLRLQWLRVPGVDDGPVRRVSTDDEGRYAFDGLATGMYHVLAEDPLAHRRAWTLALLSHDGQGARADVELPCGAFRLRGRAVYRDGRPFSGVVRLTDERTAQPTFSWVRVGGDGHFEFTGLNRGPVLLAATDPGRLVVHGLVPVEVPYEGAFTFVVDDGLEVLQGRVVSDKDGVPLAAAAWNVSTYSTDRSCTVHGTTAADGTFEALVVSRRQGEIYVVSRGFAPASRWAPFTGRPVELRLSVAARVEGRVTAAGDGVPVGGVRVLLEMNSHWGGGTAVTTADGRFAFEDQPAGSAVLLAIGGGWVPREHEDGLGKASERLRITLAPGQSTRRDLEVVRVPPLRGRVLAAGGDALKRALVTAEVSRRQPASLLKRLLALAGSRDRSLWRSAAERLTCTSTTGADGAFVLDGLLPGVAYEVKAQASDQPSMKPQRLVRERAAGAALILRFPVLRWIDVTVLDDETGAPIHGAFLGARHADKSVLCDPVRTDAEGHGRLGPLPPGPCGVLVWAQDLVEQVSPPVAPGAGPLTIRMQRGLPLAGRVLNPDGTPAAEVWVYVAREGGGVSEDAQLTDAQGRFRYSALPSGTWSVCTHAGEGLEGSVEAEAGREDVVVRLRKVQ